MLNKIIIFVLLTLSSCSNWKYKKIEYDRCVKLEKIHAHLYNHETCEWHCLNMEEGVYTIKDTFTIKYKTDKSGKLTNLKLIK